LLATSKESDSKKQNAFGIRVIGISIALVGLGIGVLGLVADNGAVAVVVGAGILLGGGAIWRL
jgi:solute:Na+ symporter, SSS family